MTGVPSQASSLSCKKRGSERCGQGPLGVHSHMPLLLGTDHSEGQESGLSTFWGHHWESQLSLSRGAPFPYKEPPMLMSRPAATSLHFLLTGVLQPGGHSCLAVGHPAPTWSPPPVPRELARLSRPGLAVQIHLGPGVWRAERAFPPCCQCPQGFTCRYAGAHSPHLKPAPTGLPFLVKEKI